ncbi:hypothetical protein [Caballeronia sp. KNU42]
MKTLFIAALAAICVGFAGCASTGTPQTATQLLATVHADITTACTVAGPTLASMQTMESGLTADQAAIVDKVYADATAFCSARSTISVASIADFANTAIPAGLKLVNASSLSTDDKTLIAIGVMALQASLNAALAQYNSALPAAVPTAASAPAA